MRSTNKNKNSQNSFAKKKKYPRTIHKELKKYDIKKCSVCLVHLSRFVAAEYGITNLPEAIEEAIRKGSYSAITVRSNKHSLSNHIQSPHQSFINHIQSPHQSFVNHKQSPHQSYANDKQSFSQSSEVKRVSFTKNIRSLYESKVNDSDRIQFRVHYSKMSSTELKEDSKELKIPSHYECKVVLKPLNDLDFALENTRETCQSYQDKGRTRSLAPCSQSEQEVLIPIIDVTDEECDTLSEGKYLQRQKSSMDFDTTSENRDDGNEIFDDSGFMSQNQDMGSQQSQESVDLDTGSNKEMVKEKFDPVYGEGKYNGLAKPSCFLKKSNETIVENYPAIYANKISQDEEDSISIMDVTDEHNILSEGKCVEQGKEPSMDLDNISENCDHGVMNYPAIYEDKISQDKEDSISIMDVTDEHNILSEGKCVEQRKPSMDLDNISENCDHGVMNYPAIHENKISQDKEDSVSIMDVTDEHNISSEGKCVEQGKEPSMDLDNISENCDHGVMNYPAIHEDKISQDKEDSISIMDVTDENILSEGKCVEQGKEPSMDLDNISENCDHGVMNYPAIHENKISQDKEDSISIMDVTDEHNILSEGKCVEQGKPSMDLDNISENCDHGVMHQDESMEHQQEPESIDSGNDSDKEKGKEIFDSLHEKRKPYELDEHSCFADKNNEIIVGTSPVNQNKTSHDESYSQSVVDDTEEKNEILSQEEQEKASSMDEIFVDSDDGSETFDNSDLSLNQGMEFQQSEESADVDSRKAEKEDFDPVFEERKHEEFDEHSCFVNTSKEIIVKGSPTIDQDKISHDEGDLVSVIYVTDKEDDILNDEKDVQQSKELSMDLENTSENSDIRDQTVDDNGAMSHSKCMEHQLAPDLIDLGNNCNKKKEKEKFDTLHEIRKEDEFGEHSSLVHKNNEIIVESSPSIDQNQTSQDEHLVHKNNEIIAENSPSIDQNQTLQDERDFPQDEHLVHKNNEIIVENSPSGDQNQTSQDERDSVSDTDDTDEKNEILSQKCVQQTKEWMILDEICENSDDSSVILDDFMSQNQCMESEQAEEQPINLHDDRNKVKRKGKLNLMCKEEKNNEIYKPRFVENSSDETLVENNCTGDQNNSSQDEEREGYSNKFSSYSMPVIDTADQERSILNETEYFERVQDNMSDISEEDVVYEILEESSLSQDGDVKHLESQMDLDNDSDEEEEKNREFDTVPERITVENGTTIDQNKTSHKKQEELFTFRNITDKGGGISNQEIYVQRKLEASVHLGNVSENSDDGSKTFIDSDFMSQNQCIESEQEQEESINLHNDSNKMKGKGKCGPMYGEGKHNEIDKSHFAENRSEEILIENDVTGDQYNNSQNEERERYSNKCSSYSMPVIDTADQERSVLKQTKSFQQVPAFSLNLDNMTGISEGDDVHDTLEESFLNQNGDVEHPEKKEMQMNLSDNSNEEKKNGEFDGTLVESNFYGGQYKSLEDLTSKYEDISDDEDESSSKTNHSHVKEKKIPSEPVNALYTLLPLLLCPDSNNRISDQRNCNITERNEKENRTETKGEAENVSDVAEEKCPELVLDADKSSNGKRMESCNQTKIIGSEERKVNSTNEKTQENHRKCRKRKPGKKNSELNSEHKVRIRDILNRSATQNSIAEMHDGEGNNFLVVNKSLKLEKGKENAGNCDFTKTELDVLLNEKSEKIAKSNTEQTETVNANCLDLTTEKNSELNTEHKVRVCDILDRGDTQNSNAEMREGEGDKILVLKTLKLTEGKKNGENCDYNKTEKTFDVLLNEMSEKIAKSNTEPPEAVNANCSDLTTEDYNRNYS